MGNGPSYTGADGQQHQYSGIDPQGNYIYDPNFPPANTAGTGATAGTGGTGAQGGSGAKSGLVQSMGPFVGNLGWGVTILSCVAAVVLVALEAIPVATAMLGLALLLAVEIGLGFLGKALAQAENWAGGDPNEPGINPLTKFIRTIAQVLGIGGILGDVLVTATIGGAIYYFMRKNGKTTVQVYRPSRINPPRQMKKVGPKPKRRNRKSK